jgi:perosamine synthetase
LIPLTRPRFGPEEAEAVREVLAGGWVAQGPTTAAFERELADAVGVAHAVATSSCTTALHLAVLAAGVGPGDEVVLPAFTFPATANAVLYAGGVPVLADVDPATLNLDPRHAERLAGPRTKAVIGVHLFGAPCEIVALRELCDAHGLFLIEDAACALGTAVGGRRAGGFGDVACFSFHARKIVTTGEGGMLTTSRPELARLLESLRTHGADRAAETREDEGLAPAAPRYVRLGYNYRLSDVQSAIGRVQLRRLDEFVRERGEIARRYDRAFADLHGLRLPPAREGAVHSYQSYVVVLERDAPLDAPALRAALGRAGISTRPGTYAIHTEPYYRDHISEPPSLPASEHAASSSVALPLYNGMDPGDMQRVIDAVRRTFARSS